MEYCFLVLKESPIEGNFVLNNTFSISLSNKITINYLVGQISREKEFKTIEEHLKFVRQVFPIEEQLT
jgi:uncharacterized protein VirK/YbjX